jgi:trans-aconitate 2-methyltransferase
VITEREHWLSITDDPEWKRNHIADPNISLDETVEAIVSAFPSDPQRILEIGCGYGRLIREISKLYPDVPITGIDINPQVLHEAFIWTGRHPHVNHQTRYVCHDNLSGMRDYDAIYSVAVFQHLPDAEKRAYIAQSYNTLRDDGVLRVQFIEGERDNHLDHWTPLDVMTGWFDDVGFNVAATETRAHPQWSWITGIK